MSNREIYENVFKETFMVNTDILYNDFAMENDGIWDSVGHMNLVGAIEEAFDIALDVEDIFAFHSFRKGMEILQRYGVEI